MPRRLMKKRMMIPWIRMEMILMVKHAKSPELAREFLLDAATVIFKEHVEKAFREGTSRQNAHRVFVFLALKLLEERLHVAFKEIVTAEKQMKLLEEEEKERREDEERKERRRSKEREKKLRRKERLREKENREMKSIVVVTDAVKEESTDVPSQQIMENHSEDVPDGEFSNTSFSYRNLKHSPRNQELNLKWSDRREGPTSLMESGFEFTRNGFKRQSRTNSGRPKSKNITGKTTHKQVWDSQKRRNSDSDFTLRSSTPDQHPECFSTSSDQVTDISMQKNHDLPGSMPKPPRNSSCLSEGDSNLYSKSQNAESTSTSDSEESTQILDEKETSNHIESKVKEAEEAASYCEKGVARISIGAQPQMNYPVFQNPTMGYYHPNPVSWPFTHSDHYLLPNGFGYGLNRNPQFLQFPAPPSINHTHAPVSQVSTNASGLKEAGCGTPKLVDDGWNQEAGKKDTGNNGFSLFHFGSPVFLSAGITEDMKNTLTNCDHPCGKKDSVDYNLFDATNGLKFSIF